MSFEDARAALIGVWELVRYEDRASETDPWYSTFGDDPQGFVMYHPAGHLSVHVAARAGADVIWPYVGYYGSYSIREARREPDGIVGIVDHVMTAAEPRELLDEGPERPFLVNGDALQLGDGRTARRQFVRLA